MFVIVYMDFPDGKYSIFKVVGPFKTAAEALENVKIDAEYWIMPVTSS